jgi:hypothetical protein
MGVKWPRGAKFKPRKPAGERSKISLSHAASSCRHARLESAQVSVLLAMHGLLVSALYGVEAAV